ncbi:GroES-like protein [Backusella circina FSU 941]|nr:GroES-like protein [Backusella circina FSU 941]
MTDTFKGWAAFGKEQPLVLTELPLKIWDEDDVEIQITDCGMCGSDIHNIDSGWYPSHYPVVVGHEITGVVTRVGKNVTKVKVGDRAGLGPIAYACGGCEPCTTGISNLCDYGYVGTYNDFWPSGDKTYGGYADKWRGNKHFVVKIPDSITNENACTFLCAGATVYAPLKRWNVGADSVVGILGMGGLGHFAVMFAKALGSRVVVMSHNDKKRELAFELGADEYINTSDEEQMKKNKRTLTHLLCTGNGRDFTWEAFIPTLKPNGVFINVNAPEWVFPEYKQMLFLFGQYTIAASLAASPEDTEEMLEIVAEKNIKAWYKTYDMKDVNKALDDFRAGKPRFRYVLKNQTIGFLV